MVAVFYLWLSLCSFGLGGDQDVAVVLVLEGRRWQGWWWRRLARSLKQTNASRRASFRLGGGRG